MTSSKDYLDALIVAERFGRNDLLTILGLLVTGLSLGGYAVYRLLEKLLSERILLSVEERQGRNMISVGLRAWELSCMQVLGKEARLAALQSAIAHTQHAVALIRSLKTRSIPRDDLLALAGTNLGYFLIQLSDLLKELHSDVDVQPFISEAEEAVEDVGIYVEAAVRARRTEDMKWWEVMESRLFVLYRATQNPDKEYYRGQIDKIRADSMVPETAKAEIWGIWSRLLA